MPLSARWYRLEARVAKSAPTDRRAVRVPMSFLAGRSERAELKKLLRGRSTFKVHTSKSLVAAALWDYGEDALAACAIDMTDEELMSVENISAWYEDPAYPLPVSG